MAKQGRLSRFLFGSFDEAKDVKLPEEEAEQQASTEEVAPEEGAVPDAAASDTSVSEDSEADAAIEETAEVDAVEVEAADAETPQDLSDEVTDTADQADAAEEEALDAVEEVEPEASAEAETPEAVEESEPAIVEPVVEQPLETSEQEAAPEKKLSWFDRLKQGLSRSSGALGDGISAIFTKRKLDDDTIQDLEDILIQADLGVETAMAITDKLAEGRFNKEVTDGEVKAILAEEVDAVLSPVAQPLTVSKPETGPHVILMIGVNGAGKTTTIGKLAQKLGDDGKKVMLAAGDTFRAAAIDQLKVWGERTGCPVVARDVGADAAGLAYDAMEQAKEEGMDVLMIDTAGRLQNRTELMDELQKIVRVIKKHDENAPHSVLLVLDATTGQNAMNQVEVFTKMAGVTGLVMTKLDGTARGGILVAISAKHKVPVHFIGVGEGVDDLEPFESRDFANAIAGLAG